MLDPPAPGAPSDQPRALPGLHDPAMTSRGERDDIAPRALAGAFVSTAAARSRDADRVEPWPVDDPGKFLRYQQ